MIWLLLGSCIVAWMAAGFEISIASNDVDSIDWSHRSLTLKRGPDLHIYHNFTIDDDGLSNSTGFIRKEVIPRHSQVLQYRGPSPLRSQASKKFKKRGFLANPGVLKDEAIDIDNDVPGVSKRYVTWNWQRPNAHCPTLIQFCFPDAGDRNALKSIVDGAFQMWADALGEDRGVRFVYTVADPVRGAEAGICYSPQGDWAVSQDAVVLVEVDGGRRAYNGIGWIPWGPPGVGRMVLDFDPGTDGSAAALAENVGTMAHELGHVMGLEHEHQRYDARNHITYLPQNIINYDRLQDAIDDYIEESGDDDMTIADVEQDRYQAYSLGLKDNYDIPLVDILPFREGDDGFTLIDFQQEGAFDWNSIMMYGSTALSVDGIRPVMVRKDNGQQFPEPGTISAGDVRAVKRIYPDNTPT